MIDKTTKAERSFHDGDLEDYTIVTEYRIFGVMYKRIRQEQVSKESSSRPVSGFRKLE
jgi:hypothetical protein